MTSLRLGDTLWQIAKNALRQRMADAVRVRVLDVLPKPVRAGVDVLPFKRVALEHETVSAGVEARVRREVKARHLPKPFLETVEVVAAG